MSKFLDCLRTPYQLAFLLVVLIFSQQIQAAPLKAVIFDCDGVLVDTEYLKFEAWQKALAPYGVTLTLEDYLPWIGHSSKNISSAILNQKKISLDEATLIREKDAIYHQRQAEGVPSLKDAVNFLKELISKKEQYQLKIGLASSAAHAEIAQNLKHIGISTQAFDSIVSGHDDLKDIVDAEGVNKPKPYIYQKIALILKVNPENCLVFEDTNAGVQAAASAGMSVLAVPNRFTIQQDFSKSQGKIDFQQFTFQIFKDKFLVSP